MLWRGSGWEVRMWFRFDKQGNSKKSWKRTLIQKILSYWMCPLWQSDLDLHGGRRKDCHGRKCIEVTSTVQDESDWVRRDLVLQGSDLHRKNQIIQQLSVTLCILLQYWYSTAVSSSLCGVYISWRAWLTWLSDPKETWLLSLTWLISINFQLASIWLLFHTLGFGQGFFSMGKNPSIS